MTVMDKLRLSAFLTIILAGSLLFLNGCHLIFPYEVVEIQGDTTYLCSAQIYRDLPGSLDEFTEEWKLYTWADSPVNAISAAF
mgnify:CR=1 FL=1